MGTNEDNILRQILEIIPHYVFWKDRDANYLGCNQAFAEAAGVNSTQEIAGKSDHDLAWTPSEADFYRQCDQDVMEFDYVLLDIEETQHKADGSEMIIQTSKVPLHDDDGNVCGILGAFTDITAKRRKEDLQHLHTIALNASSEGILMVDTNGRIRWANPAAAALSGYSTEEMIGNTTALFIRGNTENPSYTDLFDTLKNESSWTGKFCGTCKNGDAFEIRLTVTPSRNKNGQVSHYIINAVSQS
jgi:PAS domain S-box-containing protein